VKEGILKHALSNLAVLYHAQGRYAAAEPLHQHALAIRERLLGPDHPDVAMSLNTHGSLKFGGVSKIVVRSRVLHA
jgi:hypothetical protein